jgi:carbon dioxide concentrating mechanism protein CcmN
MPLPPLHSLSMTHYCASGDVTIASDAAIAAGVILKADHGGAIVIATGACIGLGTVLHAHGGTLTIGAGASLGAGSLLVGQCHIGPQACIGSSTTIYNSNVAAGALVPPASLVGEMGRPVEMATSTDPQQPSGSGQEVGSTTEKRNNKQSAPPKAAKIEAEPSPWDDAWAEESPTERSPASPGGSAKTNPTAQPSPKLNSVVYGKAQFEQIRGAMFSRREGI